MARRKHDDRQTPQEDLTPVYDDLIYDGLDSIRRDLPRDKAEAEAEDGESDTPERALSKLAAEMNPDGDEDEEDEASSRRRRKKKDRPPVEEKRERKQVPARLRKVVLVLITLVILLTVVFMILARIMPDVTWLQAPEDAVSQAVTPVQSVFSNITESITGYLRKLKLRANLETEYNKLRAENEQLVYQAMRADELEHQLAQFENIQDEMSANENMNPIACTVIGRDDGNYFSTFTINRGRRDGIQEFMAVTISGALVGYTETVKDTESTVRTIIDSEASIAGLIQSSRDQGTVRGTLGIDGQAMCRMYYLPDDHLPRPGDVVVTSGVGMSFPKGIPIGTVRESTRGMESNKQYIVVEPSVDFEHLEYVIVLRYQPTAEAVQGRSSTSSYSEYVPLATARPMPTLRIGSTTRFGETPAPTEEPAISPTPELTPTPTPSPTPTPVTTISGPVYEYNVVGGEPTPSPTPTPTPTPTPYITINPGDLTYEEDAP
ncbi:MAG: rod shape-determining protein MreC [Aristaeellaceae bacterium]